MFDRIPGVGGLELILIDHFEAAMLENSEYSLC